MGVGQDITELNAGKAELARVANDLKMLIESVRDGHTRSTLALRTCRSARALTPWRSLAFHTSRSTLAARSCLLVDPHLRTSSNPGDPTHTTAQSSVPAVCSHAPHFYPPPRLCSSIATQANAPIFVIDTAGVVTEWNKKTAEITGYTAQDMLGHVRPPLPISLGHVARTSLPISFGHEPNPDPQPEPNPNPKPCLLTPMLPCGRY